MTRRSNTSVAPATEIGQARRLTQTQAYRLNDAPRREITGWMYRTKKDVASRHRQPRTNGRTTRQLLFKQRCDKDKGQLIIYEKNIKYKIKVIPGRLGRLISSINAFDAMMHLMQGNGCT